MCVQVVSRQGGLRFSGQRFTSGQSKSLIFSADFRNWFPVKTMYGCQPIVQCMYVFLMNIIYMFILMPKTPFIG